ncbi:hypothetical protein KEM60_00611 [Austwickia sp. TVS 96-490-7B]|uniref:hypothetical protein n=1 Tax=Austwickia sp. TVS 96-490-7B TaxID=2830843 RepID=UPI001C55AA45|nr:hypothetical protein [Austwickia sp. TVS 96-490-7B]MBW3084424.1 hypothetical protein [Austwickia sp. TVS 96-490-7B]
MTWHDLSAAPTAVRRTLMERERLLHFPLPETTRDAFEVGVSENYWEVGASGGRFDLETIWQVCARRAHSEDTPLWATEDEECRVLAPDTYLLTYLLIQGERRTRRVTIWRGAGQDWVAAYHQGTVVTGQW